MYWNIRDQRIDLSHPVTMGIINCTPDSFSAPGVFNEEAIALGEQFIRQGASILDIGGESTRPGADQLHCPQEEIDRIQRTVRGLREKAIISVDTTKALVAEQAIADGAHIINDICGADVPELLDVVARTKAGYVLMRNPRNLPRLKEDVIDDLVEFFETKLTLCAEHGILDESVVLDPGIGFGWLPTEENLRILRRLPELVARVSRPILVGASRKKFIQKLVTAEYGSLASGSAAIALLAIQAGARIARVHDVNETVNSLRLLAAVQAA